MLRAGLLLSVLWWAWSAYAWLTNTLDPEEGGVRLVMFAAIAAMLIASIAAPAAIGRDATIFAVAHLIVRALHIVLYAIAGRGDPELSRAVLRITPAVAISAGLLLLASLLPQPAKLACWRAAAARSAGHLLVAAPAAGALTPPVRAACRVSRDGRGRDNAGRRFGPDLEADEPAYH